VSKNYVFKNSIFGFGAVPEINCADLKEHGSQVHIIDVRRPDEFTGELGHIEGARLSTLESTFIKDLSAWSPDESYVLVCRSGARSAQATGLALSQGLKQVWNLSGGMIAWNQAGLPIKKA
jgi:rhodanese-related sulfurtransferase